MLEVDFFIIPKQLFDKIVSHAKKCAPIESISIISGRRFGNKAVAEEAYSPENIDHSTVTFSVDPMELLAIYTDIEEKGKELIGIYHTHPAAAYPSRTDKEYMEVNPVVWLISSINSPENPLGYLLLENNTFKEIKIKISN